MATDQNSIRNVKRVDKNRINDDWAYLEEQEVPKYASIDQKFNLDYKTKGLNQATISKPKIIKSANDESGQIIKFRTQVNTTRIYDEDEDDSSDNPTITVKGKNNARWKRRSLKVNLRILTWVLWAYLVQLIFAILGLIVLGIGAGADSVIESSAVAKTVVSVADTVTGFLFGFVASDIAEGVYIFTYAIVMAVSFITLLAVYTLYIFSKLKPLSGEEGGLKMGVLLFVIIMYLSPIANLFPWIFLCMYIVWKYPR